MKSNLIWCDKCKDATSHWEGKCLICEDESKSQPQDTTLVPIEEDTQLNVTPGEWIVHNDMIKVIMDESKGIQGGIICVGKLLDDRIDNLTLMAQSKNMYAALVKVYSEIQDQLLAHRFGEILGEIKTTLNNCKPKP